jgi:hypothetical protein
MRIILNTTTHLTLIGIFFLFCSCNSASDNLPSHYSAFDQQLNIESPTEIQSRYNGLTRRIYAKQKRFTVEYPTVDQAHKNGLITLAKSYIYKTLCDSIFPHWYGTKWDFNGITQTPREGKIACGYFVTTTLKHMGYNINRVKIAQQASSHIITTMCGKGKTKVIGHNNKAGLNKYILSQKDGVFICGLDNHVGFIQKKGKAVYFIHSSGFKPQKVIKEKLMESKAIEYSEAYYVGNLLANKTNLIKWIKKEPIALVMD